MEEIKPETRHPIRIQDNITRSNRHLRNLATFLREQVAPDKSGEATQAYFFLHLTR